MTESSFQLILDPKGFINSIVLVSGGFDPIHSGHIAYLEAARQLGGYLIVGLNSDAWLSRKKGHFFLPFEERKCIIESLYMVNEVVAFDDSDNSAAGLIKLVREEYPNEAIIFANGGDRVDGDTSQLAAEKAVADANTHFAFGIGGTNKLNSSSKILERWEILSEQ